MATNSMTPALAPAPTGLDLSSIDLTGIPQDNTPAVEIVIEGEGDIEIGLMPGEEEPLEFDANLADAMDDGELGTLASDLLGEYDTDIASRKEWVDMYVKGLEVLGMKYEERTEPWENACGVYSTVLTEAAIRFQSETIIETFPAQGPVKTEIIGAIDKLKEEAAERVRVDMNYKLTEEMPEYRPEHERMLYNLGLAGAAFKKVYFDPSIDRQTSVFVPAEDLIIPYGASSARTAERVTHVMRKTKNEIRKLQAAGFYRDVDLGEPATFFSDIEKQKAEDQGFTLSEDGRYQVLEMCVDYELPGYEDPDGIARPYVITIDRGTSQVLSIRRNWSETDPLKLKRQHFVQYTYVPGFGVYGLGLIHIIGGYARAGTSLIRQLVDAGTLSNLPGGLKSRGLRIKGDDTPIAPGEFRDVDVTSGTVRDNIMPLPYKEPSQVLMALLNQITEEARRLGSVADMKVSDMSANAPVGTTLAILERQLKTMSAVQARVHYAMKEEFKLLKAIIRDNTPGDYEYVPNGGNPKAKREDYDMVEVIPVSDPNSSTMAQRIMQYQAAIQLAQGAPQIYDLPQLHRQMLEVLGIKNADKLVPIDDDMKPRDPISENMAFLTGKPAKAFIYQDHDAHIAVHTSMMQDPMVMGQMGQNPMAQQMQAAIMAHVAEHVAFQYRNQIEERLGASLPAPNAELPEQVEVQLAKLVAQAAQQLTQIHQGEAAQKQAQQQAQDPIVQMQQQELAIKQQDAQTKAQKVQGDLAVKQQELQLKAQELASRQGENPELAAAKMQQEMAMERQVHEQEMAQRQQEFDQKMAQKQQEASVKMQVKLMERANQPPAGTGE
jgi:hypothetical protein